MWRSYTTIKDLATTKRVQIIKKKDIIIAALDIDNLIIVMYIAIPEWEEITINPVKKAQIEAQNRVQVRVLLFDKALTAIPVEYSNYSNNFSEKMQ